MQHCNENLRDPSEGSISAPFFSQESTSLQQIFPKQQVGDLVSGVGLVNRDEFASTFDMGVPLDPSTPGNDHVVIFYSHDEAVPSRSTKTQTNESGVEFATQNCENLNIILTHASRKRQCVAFMGQYESFHIQKFMRLPPEDSDDSDKTDKLDMRYPLRLVSRGAQTNGRKSQKVPTIDQTRDHWQALVSYLGSLDTVLDQLRPVAQEVASNNDNNAVIVMVCNFGQSELLLNFVCNAHHKGLSDVLSNVLVFATDLETKDLAEGMGLSTFYNIDIFGSMPSNAARSYGDRNFMQMMAAKVYCVQLISMLGHDVLFSDVDVVWYQNPLPWFHDPRNPEADVYFQDDGNHALFYAPYSANTGFYYARNNIRTRYFFNSLLLAGDLIISTHSHQNALIALLNEHASMYGLKVKIWERNLEEFPGGYSFHRKKDFMKDVVQGKVSPIIFHMSWTKNKDNKIKFYEQMGEFYLLDGCQSVENAKIPGGASVSNCCATEPRFKCHYRDKPSKYPCKDSPPIDKNGKSFW
ncbi:nucleotide-diphospho-sugar transferase [Nitzschia inconspicua]|uniref:Nucleotide-diphospho-sugar transferase n=1 Tax=Nitzschia inconspicua TaxID=303405 RepID=A0A9K3LS56_9STRA|nr:nucleotide-diphospho-sugar transferase [Nitzschia inconspicua]